MCPNMPNMAKYAKSSISISISIRWQDPNNNTDTETRCLVYFWPVLAIFSQIYALFDVFFTSLNNVVVYQNGQIWGMFNKEFVSGQEQAIITSPTYFQWNHHWNSLGLTNGSGDGRCTQRFSHLDEVGQRSGNLTSRSILKEILKTWYLTFDTWLML